MQGTTDAQGDAIRTSDSFANQFLRLKNATYDLGVTIGELLLPYARKLVDTLQGLVDYVSNLSPKTQTLALRFAFLASVVGPALFAIGGMASGLSAISRSMTLLMTVVNPYVAAVAAIAAIALVIIRNWDGVNATLENTKNKLGDVVDAVGTGFKDSVEAASEAAGLALNGNWSGALDLMVKTTKEKVATVAGSIASLYLAMNGQTGGGWQNTTPDPFGIGFMTAQATTALQTFATEVEVRTNDVKTNLDGVEASTIGVKNSIEGLTILKPSFGNLKSPITEVKDEAKLASDYMRQMLLSLSPEELAKIKTDPKKMEEIAALFAMMAPKELPDPNKYNDFIENFTPTPEQEEKITRFGERMRLLSIDLDNASHFAFTMSGNISDIEEAWRPLFGTDSPQWMKDLAKYASDATLIVDGLLAMVELLKPSTWTEALGVLKDLGSGFWDIVTAIGEIIIKIGQWILAQAGIGGGGTGAGSTAGGLVGTVVSGLPTTGAGTGVPDFTGGDPGITIPGGGAGTAAGGGAMAGLLTGMTWAGGAAIIGAGINQLIQNSRIQDPWVQLGMTRAEWMQMNIESGANAAYVQALSGGGMGLTSLIGGTGGTPSWLSGLQGYIGGAPAVGMGMTSGGQTINVNLDGQTIAQATMPYWSQELEIYGTNR